MRAVIIAGLVSLFAFAGPVQAAALAGSLTLASVTGSTATVLAEQTAGDPTTLTLTNYCDAGQAFVGSESVGVHGSGTFTFSIGDRKYQGQLVTPTHCWALLYKKGPSSTVQILAELDTYGP